MINNRDYQQFEGKEEELDSMKQFFGPDSIYGNLPKSKASLMYEKTKKEEKEQPFWLETLFTLPEQLKFKGKGGFYALIGVLGLMLFISLFRFDIFNIIGIMLLIGLTVFVLLKTNYKEYSEQQNHYVLNATLTLKALFKHLPFFSSLIKNSKQVLLISVFVYGIQQLLLQWFFLYSVSSIVDALCFFGVIIGTMLLFALRETKIIYHGLAMYCLITLLSSLFYLFLFKQVLYFHIISYLFAWMLASHLEKWEIQDRELKKESIVIEQ